MSFCEIVDSNPISGRKMSKGNTPRAATTTPIYHIRSSMGHRMTIHRSNSERRDLVRPTTRGELAQLLSARKGRRRRVHSPKCTNCPQGIQRLDAQIDFCSFEGCELLCWNGVE